MKKIVLFILCLVLNSPINATHVIGGDLTYRCLGPGIYEITYTDYADCSSSGATPTGLCLVSDNSCGTGFYATLPLINTPEQIVPNCSQLSICDGGIYPGVLKCIYSDTVTLPVGCVNPTFSVHLSSRTCAITTVANPCSYNFYLSSQANNLNALTDASPVFTNSPVLYTCVNEPYCIDPGIIDPDGDSITCILREPMAGVNDFIPYDSGYTAFQFLPSSPSINFDSLTGRIYLTPTQPEVTVYTIVVYSYRNGNMISEVVRDIILYVVNCSNSQPELSGINGLSSFDTTVCVNSTTCFNILTSDPDSTDSTSISWDHGINNATFISTPGKNESAQICWTPVLSDVSSTPHCFTAWVKDNSCPANQSKLQNYCITVVDSVACLTISAGNSLSFETELKIYPQPATDYVTIDCGADIKIKNLTLYIDNVFGKRIKSSKVFDRVTYFDGLTPGIYIAYLTDDTGLAVKKRKFVVL